MQARSPALVDTGALLALLDRRDRWHGACVEALQDLPLLVRSGAIRLASLEDAELEEVERLMKKYSDQPMDFTDSSLVRLAGREGVYSVFTVDHDDFETYRIGGRRRFGVVPPRG